MNSMNPPCGTCRWWHRWARQTNPAGTFGECRRSNPVLVVTQSQDHCDRALSKWPSTREGDWCGRHGTNSESPAVEYGHTH